MTATDVLAEPIVLHFRGGQRAAAWHLLDHTPLGGTIARVNACDALFDLDGLLTVQIEADDLATFSRGERLLWDWLASLAGRGTVTISDVLAGLDRDCQLNCTWALGLATGHFGAMSPVTFGGVL